MEQTGISHHCAFCLIPLTAKDVLKCGKCLQRTYCGQECQKKDWKSKAKSDTDEPTPTGTVGGGEGQGHKDWCGQPICTEDLDWVVKEGGKGVIAKRLIQSGEKILIGNQKQISQRAGGGESNRLRLVFNHSCDANAAFYNGMDYNVGIISAEKDIEAGAEITVNIVDFACIMGNDFLSDQGTVIRLNSFEEVRNILKSRGIICPADCFCYNKEMEERILKAKENYAKLREVTKDLIQRQAKTTNVKIIEELQKVLLEMDAFQAKRLTKAQVICNILAAMGPYGMIPQYKRAIRKYQKEALGIFRMIFHPDSSHDMLRAHMAYL